jgi:hypothetical protein
MLSNELPAGRRPLHEFVFFEGVFGRPLTRSALK